MTFTCGVKIRIPGMPSMVSGGFTAMRGGALRIGRAPLYPGFSFLAGTVPGDGVPYIPGYVHG